MKSEFVVATLLFAAAHALVACHSKKTLIEPQVAEIATDAAPAPILDAAPPPKRSLYERLGGREAFPALVDAVVQRVEADPRLHKSFAKTVGARADHFKAMLTLQLCALSGGPDCSYTGRPMDAAHAKMKISGAQFDAFIDDVRAALTDRDVASDDQDEFVGLLTSLRDQIVEPK